MTYEVTITLESPAQLAGLIELIARDHSPLLPSIRFSTETNGDYNANWALDGSPAPKPAHMKAADERASAAFRKIKKARAEADRFIAERDAKHEATVAVEERRARAAWKNEQKLGLMLDAIGSLACPQCFAEKNIGCTRTGRREPDPRFAHGSRVIAMLRGLTTEDMAHMMSVKQAERAEIERINEAVACPMCEAERFNPCHTAGGHVMRHYAHKARRSLYNDERMGIL
jgi:hypothetical protein